MKSEQTAPIAIWKINALQRTGDERGNIGHARRLQTYKLVYADAKETYTDCGLYISWGRLHSQENRYFPQIGMVELFMKSMLAYTGIAVPLGGRKYECLMAVHDFLVRHRGRVVAATAFGALDLDTTHRPQRMLSYAFENHLAFYRRSELGKFIARAPLRGAMFVDVGANLGMYSLLARECGAETILIEPEPLHVDFLQRNAAIFGTVLPVAVSDCAGTLPIYVNSDKNSGAHSIIPSQKKSEGAIVKVDTLSHILRSEKAQNVKLIKVDVEGAEAGAIKGLVDFVKSGMRPTIWCEVRGDTKGDRSGTCWPVNQMLQELGYSANRAIASDIVPMDLSVAAAQRIFDIRFEPQRSGHIGVST